MIDQAKEMQRMLAELNNQEKDALYELLLILTQNHLPAEIQQEKETTQD